jgi:CzcA family heavy metal efflux pump
MWLTRLALRYPISTFLIAVTILVLGIVSFVQLPIDLLPNITIPVVSTITFYAGASPLDMEQSVTVFTERAVSSVNDVNYVQSATREGISQVRIFFNWDANLDVGLVDVVQRVNRIMNQLPTGVSQPVVARFDITSLPVCNIAISGNMDQRDLYDLALNTIEPQIEHLSGVASAAVAGGRVREIHVTLDRDRIQALQLPVQSILTAVANSNLIIPSGDLKTGPFDYSLKTESRFNVVKPMGDIIVQMVNGVPIHIRDIGTVDDSYQEQTEIIRVDGRPGVTLSVQKLANANTVQVVDNVLRALPKLVDVPPGLKMSLSFDQSVYIKQTISGLRNEALIGAFLAMLIIMAFLRNLRGTLIIIVAIPLSILIAFIWFRFGNSTLNIMTFGGLALVVGRLVDDSIVELEAISRHYNERREGVSKLQATLDAAKEVASPIFISTLSTVIVFLPIVFVTGIAKLLFIPLAVTITVALFGSFFVSRTVTPLMCLNLLLPERIPDPASRRFSDRFKTMARDWITALDEWYAQRLRWALGHRRTVVFGVLGIAAVSLVLVKFIGTEFFPDQDEGQFTVTIKLPVGTRVEDTEDFVSRAEQVLRRNIPEMQTMISDVGVPSAKSGGFAGARGNSGTHAANIRVALVSTSRRNRSVFQIVQDIRPKLMTLPGASIYITAGGFLKFLLNFGASAPIDVEVRGFDLDTGTALSKKVAGIVRSVPGATDVQISREDNLPELRVQIDRERAGVLGISVAEIANTINTMIDGTVASLYTDPQNGNEYNILVRLSEGYRSHIEDLPNVVLNTPDGRQVLLGSVARITKAASPVEIDRKYQQRLVEVTGNVGGRDLGSISKDIQRQLDTLTVPAGFEVRQTGNVEQQNQTFRVLLLALLLAVLLVYVVMASQFQSLVDPLIIMFTVPLGMVGVLWILFLTGTTLSVTSFQGVIIMIGVVVSNGVLLVDYTNHLRLRGLPLREAVVTGGKTRLKPIIMTTLATVLGLIPMALGLGGESTQAPLAIAVIGGLTVSSALTLFFIPVLYTLVEERFKRRLRLPSELIEE